MGNTRTVARRWVLFATGVAVLLLVGVIGSWLIAGNGDRASAPATWHLDPKEPPPNASSRVVPVVASYMECNGGAPAADVLRYPPKISYSPTAIRIDFRARPARGQSNCQGVPFARYTVQLTQPLAGRRLVDVGNAAVERYPHDSGRCFFFSASDNVDCTG